MCRRKQDEEGKWMEQRNNRSLGILLNQFIIFCEEYRKILENFMELFVQKSFTKCFKV